MSRLRGLWFESPHLETGAPGLRATLAGLPPAARDEILAIGDRLAEVSLMLAQQYCRAAPRAHAHGAPAFRRWVEWGERLAAEEDGSRATATAYFTLDPDALLAVPVATVEAWLALARRVLGASRRLGERFVAESGPLLGELDDPIGRLGCWVDLGLALAATGGFEGDLMAAHFFGATALATPLFARADFARWAELGRAAERLGAGRAEFFTSVPPALHALSEAERGAVLLVAHHAVVSAPVAALELYFTLPGALASLPAGRDALIASLEPVTRAAPGTLGDLLPVLRAILEETPPEDRAALITHARTVGAHFPAGVVPFYRVLPRLLERTGPAGIERWALTGLRVAAEHPAAGAAFFALDSRTSRAVLAAESTAVEFAEVQGLLKRLLQALTGTSWQVAASPDVGYRPPFAAPTVAEGGAARGGEAPPTGTAAVPAAASVERTATFPLRVDAFATAEDNLRLHRLIAAQHAGRVEFGTERLTPPLAEFLAGFDLPEMAEELLAICEGVRVDAAVARTYRGLGADLAAFAADSAHADLRLPGTVAHLERVLREARLPEVAASLAATAARLAAPEATVADSAAAAAALYARMARAIPGLARASEPEGFGDYLAELEHLEEGLAFDAGRAASAEGGEPAPGEPERDAEPIDERPPTIELEPDVHDGEPGTPMDPAELLRLLRAGADVVARQGSGDDVDALGLYVSDLAGKLPRERMAELQGWLRDAHGGRAAPAPPADEEGSFLYDEWDHRIGDYRSAWCRLAEIPLASDTGDFFHHTLAAHADLLPEIRRQFQQIRPERYRVVHGLEDGEDFDLDAVITARADRRSGHAPSPKLYQARQREERDVATLFLLDMSASTDEPVPDAPPGRRVIDIIKEALVVMTEALEEIGDTYGIYGFSGHGRRQVEFYLVKHFHESLTGAVKGRIGAIEPRRSTRMGTALRHAVARMRGVGARSKHVLLLSDGFPQDLDYGDDRRSNTYGIQDTMMAFQEAARVGVTPFCITVDRAGHDYLKEICDAARYLVIEDLTALPRELPKIYQRFVRP